MILLSKAIIIIVHACIVLMVGAIAGRGVFTESLWPFHFVDVNCSGLEMTLFDCPHNNLVDFYSCHSTRDASVRCHGKQLWFHFKLS